MKECNINTNEAGYEVFYWNKEENFEPDSLSKLSEFPVEELHPTLQLVIKEIAKKKKVGDELVACLVLALASACIGKSRRIRVNKNWHQYGNLFFVILGESGDGKSHTFNYVFQHLKEINNNLITKWKKDYEAYQNSLNEWKKSKKNTDDRPIAPPKISYLVNDTTVEALMERLEQNPRGQFLYRDEFSGFLEKLDKYTKSGAGDGREKLIHAWDASTISISRKSQDGVANEIHIENAVLGLFGAMQPGLIKETFKKNDLRQGLLQRFLFCRSSATNDEFPEEINEQTSSTIKDITEKLLDYLYMIDGESKHIEISKNGLESFKSFFEDMKRKYKYTVMNSFAIKMTNMVLRLALIIHYLNAALNRKEIEPRGVIDQVEEKTMKTAMTLGCYFMQQAERVVTDLLREDKDFVEITSGHRLIAKVIIKYEAEIKEQKGKVSNTMVYQWMSSEGIKQTQTTIGKLLKEIKVDSDRDMTTRYKIFKDETFAFCKSICKTVPLEVPCRPEQQKLLQ